VNARDRLAEALTPHQSWCHAEAHGGCCGAGDCDCGVADALDRLEVVVAAIVAEKAAEELEAAARHIGETPVPATHVPSVWAAVLHLRDRAAALRPDSP
jgi:hypothetical protein